MDQAVKYATQMLTEASRGNTDAAGRLLPLVYDRLRQLASGYLHRERAGHTLQPTALVNEAYLKLADQSSLEPVDRTHFIAIAARGMRQILIDHARRRDAAKRGGGQRKVSLEDAGALTGCAEVDLEALHEALTRLADHDRRVCDVVELRFFGGLTNAEVAEVLGVSLTTVEGDWRHARAWLRRALADHEGP